MNKETTKDFKVIAEAGITVITPPVHFDVNTVVTLNATDQRTIDQLANGEIEAIDNAADQEEEAEKATEEETEKTPEEEAAA